MLNKKYVYTEEEVTKLSKEELLDIISITTSNNSRIYFDSISSIELDEVVFKNGESIPLVTEGIHEELLEKFSRYKMFCIMHDAKENSSSIERVVNNFENIMSIKVEEMEKSFSLAIDGINGKVEEKLLPLMDEIKQTSQELRATLDQTIIKLEKKISLINTGRLDDASEKIEKIINLMTELVE